MVAFRRDSHVCGGNFCRRAGLSLPCALLCGAAIFVSVGIASVLAGPTQAPVDAGGIQRLATALADVNSEWSDREDAEIRLAELPPDKVLPVLLAKLPARPGGPVYPMPESAGADKDGPAPWLAYYAMRRAVSAQTGKHGADTGPLLADLLTRATGSEARLALAEALRVDWSDRAESALAVILRQGGENADARSAAAAALLAHRRDRYYEEVRALALNAGHPLQRRLFSALVAARPTAGRGIDPVVAVLGFELLQHDRRAADTPAAGYSMAILLEQYLQVTFRPDASNPRYRRAGDASDEFRADTIAYAIRWWTANGPAMQSEAAKLRPAPT